MVGLAITRVEPPRNSRRLVGTSGRLSRYFLKYTANDQMALILQRAPHVHCLILILLATHG